MFGGWFGACQWGLLLQSIAFWNGFDGFLAMDSNRLFYSFMNGFDGFLAVDSNRLFYSFTLYNFLLVSTRSICFVTWVESKF